MRWQPWARAVVAIAGLACAVTIYMLYGARKAPSRMQPPPVVDATTTSQMAEGEYRRVKDGRETLKINYASRTVRSDSSVRFEQAHVKSLDERALEVWADVIESKGKSAQADNPAELLLTGHVRLKTKDGLEALMDNATYDDGWGTLSTPGHITFTKARMSGQGEGATYSEKDDVLSLLDRAHVVIAGEAPGTRAFEATSRQMTLFRPARLVRLERESRIVRDKDALSSDNAVLHMTNDESKLTRIELSGHARVEPGVAADAAAPPDMRADEIDLNLRDDGQTIRQAGLTSRTDVAVVDMTSDAGHRIVKGSKIGFDLARDGQTLTRLDADEHVKVTLPKTTDNGPREILSDTLRASGVEQKGLTSALFEGRSVTYSEELLGRTEPGLRARTVVSRSLKLTLDGQLDAVSRALFTGDVDLKDPDGYARAAIADYDPAGKLMLLRPAGSGAAAPPIAGNTDRRVTAREINLHIDSSDLDATGNVQTTSNPSSTGGEGRTASPLFSTDAPIQGSGETLKLVGDDATYTGTAAVPARLRQDSRHVVGRVIRYNSKTSSLRADGAVEALMIADTANKKDRSSAPSEYRVEKADSLVYEDTTRTAVFKGPLVKVVNKDGTTTARSFEVKFAPDSGAVQQLIWDGDVRADLPDKKRGVGDRLRYDADADRYDLTGNPAQVLYAKTDGSGGCALSSGGRLTFDRTSGSVQGSLSEDPKLPCDTTLPYKKDKEKDHEPMATLRTEGLTKSYGGRTVVRDINLDVSSGEIVGLLGPNGAGKTTTFGMVVGLTGADAGEVLLDDERVTSDPMYVRARKGIGYLPQEPSVFRGLTVEQNVLAILETQPIGADERRRRLAELLGELNLTPLARSKGHSLSGGERRRVEITRALVNQPKFMLLDEPFAGIDPIAVSDIQKIVFHLRDNGIGVLITDHNVRETLKITDRAYIVHGGVIFRSGTPASLAADEEVKRIYLGADFRLD